METHLIETDRCYVREFAESDMDAVFALYDSPHITDYIEPLWDYDKELEYRRLYIERIYCAYGFGLWVVLEKKSGRLIGEAGLERRTGEVRKKYPRAWMLDKDTAELGFCFAEDLWGQGYATEVCRAILDYGKEKIGLQIVFARANAGNAASVRVLEKLGFSPCLDGYYRIDL